MNFVSVDWWNQLYKELSSIIAHMLHIFDVWPRNVLVCIKKTFCRLKKKVHIKPAGYFKARSLILGFYVQLFYLLDTFWDGP